MTLSKGAAPHGQSVRTLAKLRTSLALNSNELATLFGVRADTVKRWTRDGLPARRARKLQQLNDVALELQRRFRAASVSRIIRAKLPILAARSILEVLGSDGPEQLYELFRRWSSYNTDCPPIRPGERFSKSDHYLKKRSQSRSR